MYPGCGSGHLALPDVEACKDVLCQNERPCLQCSIPDEDMHRGAENGKGGVEVMHRPS